MAKRVVGYFQSPLGVVGLVFTLTFGLRFFVWFFTNQARLNDPEADPVAALVEMWQAIRWALLGIGLFAMGWLWALITSLSLLRQAKEDVRAGEGRVPPRIASPPEEATKNR